MTETSLLQGEITENPHEQELDVEGLLLRFVRALVAEQSLTDTTSSRVVPPSLSPPEESAAERVAVAAELTTKPKAAPIAVAGTVAMVSSPITPPSRILSLVRPQGLEPSGDRT